MNERTESTVDCPVCETAFDPTAAGGWCTNPECGEWRYEEETGEGWATAREGAESDTGWSELGSGGEAGDDDGDPNARVDVAVSDAVQPARSEPESEPEPESEGEAGRTDADTGDERQDHAQDATVETPELAIECPDCGTALEADTNFCPECGTDVSALPEGEQLETCPECDDDVDPEDNFCASCGADLRDAKPEPEPLTECPSCGVEVGPEDSYCVECGEHLDPHRPGGDATEAETTETDGDAGAAPSSPANASASDADAGREAPAALVLTTRGRELTVSDGDTIGRRVRRIVAETDEDEEAAVRIHREHIRFIREDGQFYIVDLGDNPTRVNDQHLNKGDRQPIGPGDELGLSGVVTLNVDRP